MTWANRDYGSCKAYGHPPCQPGFPFQSQVLFITFYLPWLAAEQESFVGEAALDKPLEIAVEAFARKVGSCNGGIWSLNNVASQSVTLVRRWRYEAPA